MEHHRSAPQAIEQFETDCAARYPKAVTSQRRDEAELFAFFDFPARHWLRLRTANGVELR